MIPKNMLEDVILVAIALFVEAVFLPPALVTIATATLTSVNAAVKPLFTVVIPILAIIATIFIFLKYLRQSAQ